MHGARTSGGAQPPGLVASPLASALSVGSSEATVLRTRLPARKRHAPMSPRSLACRKAAFEVLCGHHIWAPRGGRRVGQLPWGAADRHLQQPCRLTSRRHVVPAALPRRKGFRQDCDLRFTHAPLTTPGSQAQTFSLEARCDFPILCRDHGFHPGCALGAGHVVLRVRHKADGPSLNLDSALAPRANGPAGGCDFCGSRPNCDWASPQAEDEARGPVGAGPEIGDVACGARRTTCRFGDFHRCRFRYLG